jgi:hypothetical protein
MEEDRGALLTISDKRPNLRAKEADLQKLRKPVVEVTVEDADSEVEEVDEQDKASIQDSRDPCAVALTNPKVVYEAKKAGVQAACTSAIKAAADALCAGAIAVTVTTSERKRERKNEP